MRDEPRDPLLENLLEAHREVLLRSLWIHLPGQITAYDETTGLASVVPMVQDGEFEEDGVTRTVKTLPEIHDCPVAFPGSGKNRQTFPVAKGDTCLIMWCSSYIARWVVTGEIVDPGDDRRCDYADAVVLAGLSSSKIPTDAPLDAIVTHADSGVKIRLGDSSIDDTQGAVVVHAAQKTFGQALNSAITAMTTAVDPAVSALTALRTALGIDSVTGEGWDPGTTVTKAK